MSPKLSQSGRLDKIKDIIRLEKKVVVTDLSKEFRVTEETIRRDLDKLEEEGLVTRTYGGAILNVESITEKIDFVRRAQTNVEEKHIIAKLTVPLIGEDVQISADSSSTVMEVLKLLKHRKDLTVLTNSLIIFNELDQTQMEIISTGGTTNKDSLSLGGIIAKTTLENYRVDTALISCKGLHINEGIFDSNDSEAELKKILIKHARRVILLADHSKFNKFAFVKIMELSDIDILVTDREPSPEWKRLFQRMNTMVIHG